jgi:putative SOS response-associated peptidase YedK
VAKDGQKEAALLVTVWDGGPFVFAELWERWHGEERDVQSGSIVTTDANELMRPCGVARRWVKHAASYSRPRGDGGP